MKMKQISSIILWCMVLWMGSLGIETAYAEEESLVMGIFPRRNATVTIKLFRPIAEYLSDQLNREIKLVTTKDFKSFWNAVKAQQYDIVHYNQYHYMESHKKFGYQVILKNSEFGNPTIGGSIVVRKDSGINSVMDLKGKKIVFGGGPRAMQSYIVATWLLREAGLQKDDYIEEFAKNPPNAIMASFFKQADAAGAGDVVLRLPVVKKKINIDELKFLARSEAYPHLPWAVKGSMEPSLRNKIQSLLAGLKGTPEGQKLLKGAKLSSLEVAVDKDYDWHRKIVKEVLGESY